MEMSASVLRDIIKQNDLYTTAALNDILYLHFKGFFAIQNLEAFTGLKTLYLEGNTISKVENLDTQSQLRELYLQDNAIKKIENLENCTDLCTLNLSGNCISTIENLSNLKKLSSLILSNNSLSDVESIRHVAQLDLRSLDIQSNGLEGEVEDLLRTLELCPKLSVLYLRGNPIVKRIPHYRKMVVFRCVGLKYLDDRPVSDDERRRAGVWGAALLRTNADGAAAAEKAEADLIWNERRARDDESFRHFEALYRRTGAEPSEDCRASTSSASRTFALAAL